MARCELHCPGGSAGAVAVAVIAVAAAVFAVAEFAVEYALILVPGLAAVGAAAFALQRFLLARTVAVWRPQHAPLAIGRAEAPRVVEGATAPLAIEARHVIPGVVISNDTRKEAST